MKANRKRHRLIKSQNERQEFLSEINQYVLNAVTTGQREFVYVKQPVPVISQKSVRRSAFIQFFLLTNNKINQYEFDVKDSKDRIHVRIKMGL